MLYYFGAYTEISEFDKTHETKWRYLIFHNVWHLGIFCILHKALKEHYKNVRLSNKKTKE